jgi:murein DD-endopeptidase MepM/ murein hydrolase activator NlpD
MNPLPGSVKTQGIHGYNGVDLGGVSAGSPVLAAAGGTVIVAKSAGWNGGYGSYVVVQHNNGTQTLYAHLNSVSVNVGQGVSVGEKVGGVGSTGRSTGIHLHFEVRGDANPFR